MVKWKKRLIKELDKTLAAYNKISTGDQDALLHAFAGEFNDYPTPPSPMEQAEQARVEFIDLNGDGDGAPEMIVLPIGDICGAATEARNRRDAFIRELLNDVEVYPYTKDTGLLAGIGPSLEEGEWYREHLWPKPITFLSTSTLCPHQSLLRLRNCRC